MLTFMIKNITNILTLESNIDTYTNLESKIATHTCTNPLIKDRHIY